MPDTNGMADGPVRNSETLDLLLDVELPVSISFGKTRMPLQQVLRWTTGSIVELESEALLQFRRLLLERYHLGLADLNDLRHQPRRLLLHQRAELGRGLQALLVAGDAHILVAFE